MTWPRSRRPVLGVVMAPGVVAARASVAIYPTPEQAARALGTPRATPPLGGDEMQRGAGDVGEARRGPHGIAAVLAAVAPHDDGALHAPTLGRARRSRIGGFCGAFFRCSATDWRRVLAPGLGLAELAEPRGGGMTPVPWQVAQSSFMSSSTPSARR